MSESDEELSFESVEDADEANISGNINCFEFRFHIRLGHIVQ